MEPGAEQLLVALIDEALRETRERAELTLTSVVVDLLLDLRLAVHDVASLPWQETSAAVHTHHRLRVLPHRTEKESALNTPS
jgi:hypothetical protein